MFLLSVVSVTLERVTHVFTLVKELIINSYNLGYLKYLHYAVSKCVFFFEKCNISWKTYFNAFQLWLLNYIKILVLKNN